MNFTRIRSLSALAVLVAICAIGAFSVQAEPPRDRSLGISQTSVAERLDYPAYSYFLVESAAALVFDDGLRTNIPTFMIDGRVLDAGSAVPANSFIIDGEVQNYSESPVLVLGLDGQIFQVLPGQNLVVAPDPVPYGVTCICECGSSGIAVYPGNSNGSGCQNYNGMRCIDPNDNSIHTTANCARGLGPIPK